MKQGGTDLARRWLAALMLVPEDEREAAVGAIEKKVADLYGERQPVMKPRKAADRKRSGSTGEAMERLRESRGQNASQSQSPSQNRSQNRKR